MKCILLFVLFISACTITLGQRLITDITCTTDSDCNRGDCIDYNNGKYCQCDALIYPKNINGTEVPCVEPIGKVAPAGIISFVVIYAISLFIIIVTQISVMVAFALSEKAKNHKKIKSWQYDPRVTISNLVVGALLAMVYDFLLLAYAFGHLDDPIFLKIADLGKAFYFQAGTAIIFYWFLAVQKTPARAQEIVKYPILAFTFCIFIIWWAISHFVTSEDESVKNSIALFKLILSLLFMVFLIFGLAFYGRQVLTLLAPQAKANSQLARRIAFFLYTGAFILTCLVILLVLSGIINAMNRPHVFIGCSLWIFMILEWLIHTIFLVIFSGGSLARVGKGVIWAWRGKSRQGKSPMDVDIVKGSDTVTPNSASSKTGGSRNSTGSGRGADSVADESKDFTGTLSDNPSISSQIYHL